MPIKNRIAEMHDEIVAWRRDPVGPKR